MTGHIIVPPARWVPAMTAPVVRAVIERALADIGILEMPPGSNRSGVIDGYNRVAGVPLGSYWCASAVGRWWRDVELAVPRGYASCDAWMAWAKETNRWSAAPALGAAVLYGRPGDANHIGLIVRTDPLVLSVEGNTTVEGGTPGESRNGVAVSLKVITARDSVLGYVLPFPRTAP